METNSSLATLSPQQLCSVESAALRNPIDTVVIVVPENAAKLRDSLADFFAQSPELRERVKVQTKDMKDVVKVRVDGSFTANFIVSV